MISVIMPVYFEEAINEQIKEVKKVAEDIEIELIVCGINNDPTLFSIQYADVKKVIASKGRAAQMNAGAKEARFSTLLFLHADTLLPKNAFEKVLRSRQEGFLAGAFDLAISPETWYFKLIAKTASLRSRLTKHPYGDQALFIDKSLFFELGAYKELALMEDVALMQAVKQRKVKLAFISSCVKTSARRWQKEGIVYGVLRNWLLISLYYLGVHPNKLKKFYK